MTDELTKIMVATDPADVAQMAIIECLRQIADNGKIANRQLEGMQAELRDVRERVIRIEASEFKAELNAVKAETERLRKEDLSRIAARVTALEMDKAERTGGTKFADALLKYGPFIIALITALFVVLVATKRIVL
jgi:hypothetical protein